MNKKAILYTLCTVAVSLVAGVLLSGGEPGVVFAPLALICAFLSMVLWAKIWIICDEIHEYLESKRDEEDYE